MQALLPEGWAPQFDQALANILDVLVVAGARRELGATVTHRPTA